MSGRSSRQKGYRGEAEVIDLLRGAGHEVDRRGSGDAGDDIRFRAFPDWYVEVRRRETLAIPAWCREIEAKAEGKTALLIFRRSREPWRVCLLLNEFLRLMEVGK